MVKSITCMRSENPTNNPVENELAVRLPPQEESMKDEGVMIGGVSPDPVPPSSPRMFEGRSIPLHGMSAFLLL